MEHGVSQKEVVTAVPFLDGVSSIGKATDSRYEIPLKKTASTEWDFIQLSDEVAKHGISENIMEQVLEICRKNLSLDGPYTIVIPFADNDMINRIAKTIEEKMGYFTTTKVQRPKRKTIRGWVQVTGNLVTASDSRTRVLVPADS